MIEFTLDDHAAKVDALTRAVLGAAKGAIGDATKRLERDLEDATRSAVRGRLWRAWRSEVYPGGGRIAQNPVGEVFVSGKSRSQGAMVFHTRAGRIKNKDGFFLAIPLPAAGTRGRGRDLSPGEWERQTGRRLRFVYRPGRASLLVADMGTTGRGGTFRPITRARTKADDRRGFVRGAQTVPIFVLVPQVSFANSFAVEPIAERSASRLDDDFVARVRRL
jgi:hypothetical protein